VVTASWDKTTRVWDAATGKPLIGALEHQDRVASAAFSPDGTRVVTASYDKTARVSTSRAWRAGSATTVLVRRPPRIAERPSRSRAPGPSICCARPLARWPARTVISRCAICCSSAARRDGCCRA